VEQHPARLFRRLLLFFGILLFVAFITRSTSVAEDVVPAKLVTTNASEVTGSILRCVISNRACGLRDAAVVAA
jgi:hypothetical protein